MEIKFYENGSFVGAEYSMVVNGQDISLGGINPQTDEAKSEAIRILREGFNIDHSEKEIVFEFGGKL
jgi:hypothetical protein